MAAEYSSLKVPELKKLLAEKGLPQTGNKADLIARLQEHDKKAAEEKPAVDSKEDEITYSDDEVPAPAVEAKPAAQEPAAAPAATDAEPAEEKPAEEPQAEAEPAAEAAAEPAQNFALGLSSSVSEEEAKKRAARAKRFGIEDDDDTKKRAERGERFGIDQNKLTAGLDSALPERSLKRGRGRGENQAEGDNRPGKRQSTDGRNPRRGGRNNRDNGRGGNRDNRDNRDSRDNRDNRPRGGNADGNSKASGILNDPAEAEKAAKRRARFAS